MKIHNFGVQIVAFMLVFVTVFSTTANITYAACSDNGLYHSDKKCANSFNNYKDYGFEFQKQLSNLKNKSFYDLINRLQAMIKDLENNVDENEFEDDVFGDSDLMVTTRTVVEIEKDSAFLRGRVFLNNEDEAKVYFEYGDSKSNLDEKTKSKTIDDSDSNFSFSTEIDDLDKGETYYYRAVGVDEDGDKSFGTILSFRTSGSSNNDNDDNDSNTWPDLETNQVDNITDEEVELNGFVDMNDFKNGVIFFVFGEDKSLVSDVVDDYNEYADIDEDSDDLQKFIVDKDLDGSSHYQLDIDGLNDDTKIYYAICAEYEDDDNDVKLDCGSTKSFTTDEI